MKKKDITKIVIIAIVILFVIPFLINFSFKTYSIRFLVAEWSAGDLLSFYGAVLGALITLIGLIVTLNYQSKQARKVDEIKYKPILKLKSVETENNGFMGRRELKILFPYHSFNGDEFKVQKENYFYKQAEIKEVDWDQSTHLYIGTSVPLSLGEILVDESADIIISLPNFLFLKEGQINNHIWFYLTVSYDDVFLRNRRTLKILSDFQIIPRTKAPAPYFYKEGFEYYEVEVLYMGSQQIK